MLVMNVGAGCRVHIGTDCVIEFERAPGDSAVFRVWESGRSKTVRLVRDEFCALGAGRFGYGGLSRGCRRKAVVLFDVPRSVPIVRGELVRDEAAAIARATGAKR